MTEPEAPAGYVTFVARHLPTLRSESDRLTGDRGLGDEIYSDALSAVAARWRWLELLRTRLDRPAVAEAYLRRTLVARARRWRDEQLYPVEVSAAPPRPHWAVRVDAVEAVDIAPPDPERRRRWWRADHTPEGRAVDVAHASTPPLVPATPFAPAPPARGRDAGPTGRFRTGDRVSLGLRQAAFLSPEYRAPTPVAEAAIAWWHAYETVRRRRRVGLAAALLLLFTALTQVALRH